MFITRFSKESPQFSSLELVDFLTNMLSKLLLSSLKPEVVLLCQNKVKMIYFLKFCLVTKDNFKQNLTEIDYLITPKTKSHAKDMARIHDKLKKASSLKVFTEVIENEARKLMIVAPEWIEECL